MRFDPRQSLVFVSGQVFGPQGELDLVFAIDTGATYSLVSRRALLRLGYNPFLTMPARFFNTDDVRTADLLRIQQIRLLDHTWEKTEVVMHDLPAASGVDGLIGLDLLRGKRLTLDFRLGELTLD